MSGQGNVIDKNHEIVDETPQIEVPAKIKKAISAEKNRTIKQARLKEQKRKEK